MKLKENLEMVEVKYDNNKVEMLFVDEEEQVLRVVQFNKDAWDDKASKFVPNLEKAAKVEEWSNQYFNTSFEGIADCVGVRKNVYVYDNYCSLWETNETSKFSDDEVGQIEQGEITEIILDNIGIRIKFKFNEKIYESKMSYSVYLEYKKQYMIDPIKQKKQIEKFKDKFGVSVEEKDKLVGQKIMFEVRKAMGKFVYADIKKFAKKKK